MISRPLYSGILTDPAADSWGDPFAVFERRSVGRCVACGTEMIAGPGQVLPDACSVCQKKRPGDEPDLWVSQGGADERGRRDGAQYCRGEADVKASESC